MRIGMEIQPQMPVWAVKITLRNIKPGYDDRMVYDFIQTAFDKPGRTPPTYDRWHDFMMGANNFDPELWFLVFHEDELIGAILCFEYPQYGWVRQLGVSPKWQGKGIGMALLKYVFRIFYDRGYSTVGLGVESVNTNAYLLYEKAGMKRKRCYIEYQKEISCEG
jgi:ribosomal protein S18 acetylase RimI-like enzyme